MTTSYILQEDGFKILLEDGSGALLLEDEVVVATTAQHLVRTTSRYVYEVLEWVIEIRRVPLPEVILNVLITKLKVPIIKFPISISKFSTPELSISVRYFNIKIRSTINRFQAIAKKFYLRIDKRK